MVVVAEKPAAEFARGARQRGRLSDRRDRAGPTRQRLSPRSSRPRCCSPNPMPAPSSAADQRALPQAIESRSGPVMPVLARLTRGRRSPAARCTADRRSTTRPRGWSRGCARRCASAPCTPPCCAALAPKARPRLRCRSPMRQIRSTTRPCCCVGRGRSYPALVGRGRRARRSDRRAQRRDRARAISTPATSTAWSSATASAARVVEALLTVLAEDARFRDLPVGVLDEPAIDDERAAQSRPRRRRSGPAGRAHSAVRPAAGVRDARSSAR